MGRSKFFPESWGRLSCGQALVMAPQSQPVAQQIFAQEAGTTLIPFGAGRSYGDQALNSEGAMVLTSGLDRIVTFNATTGELVCEAGVSLRRIVEQFLPWGFLPPASPGTGFVTVGGCVANDVHGKNHEHLGSFGQHIVWLDLLLPSGQVRRVHAGTGALFRATVGGMGLTGLILRVCLNLVRVPSNAVVRREERIPSLDVFLDRLETERRRATYSVGWIDALATGSSLGRGILETAEPTDVGLPPTSPTRFTLSYDMPAFLLNAMSIRVFNETYYRRIPASGRETRVGLQRFLFPLDTIAHWNRLYGNRGFFQFQCALPDEAAPRGLRRLLETVSTSHAASFLGVIKTLGGNGVGYLSFPMRGYTLALDFPNRPGVDQLLTRLEAITLEHGGRIYLAKDAVLSAAGFRRMYPDWKEFSQVLDEIDPNKRMMSNMARRLGIREGISAEIGGERCPSSQCA